MAPAAGWARARSYIQNTQRCFFLIPNKQTAYTSFIIHTLFIIFIMYILTRKDMSSKQPNKGVKWHFN